MFTSPPDVSHVLVVLATVHLQQLGKGAINEVLDILIQGLLLEMPTP
jgi:hypothetical protein